MRTSHRVRSCDFTIQIACMLLLAGMCSSALGDDFAARNLPLDDRQLLDQYLGGGVVGEALPAPVLPRGVNDFITVREGMSWRLRITAGKAQGSIQTGSAALLARPGQMDRFRVDTGDGRNVLFGQLDAKGNLLCYASQDNQEGVISRFSPPQPIFLADMVPGQSQSFTSDVSVCDLSNPDVETHHGRLEIETTYEGAYRLHVPAGNFDAVLFRTSLRGKIGPADVQDTIYRFFSKGQGFVAMVETEYVSAVLIYHEKTRVGKVLVQSGAK